jgi:hypothetical protein
LRGPCRGPDYETPGFGSYLTYITQTNPSRTSPCPQRFCMSTTGSQHARLLDAIRLVAWYQRRHFVFLAFGRPQHATAARSPPMTLFVWRWWGTVSILRPIHNRWSQRFPPVECMYASPLGSTKSLVALSSRRCHLLFPPSDHGTVRPQLP